jgi:hypothetical protein
MSTKTNFKRVALVAVASLGLGVLTSVAPANAVAGVWTAPVANGPVIVTFDITTATAGTVTIGSSTSISIPMVAGTAAEARVTVDGGTITGATLAPDTTAATYTSTSFVYGDTAPTITFTPNAGVSLMTITSYATTSAYLAGTKAAEIIATIKAVASIGVISPANSFVSVVAAATTSDPADNVDVAAAKAVAVGTNGRINYVLKDGNNVEMVDGSVVTATATGGCLVGLTNTSAAFLSTSATQLYAATTTGYGDEIFLARSVTNAPATCTVTFTVNGLLLGTKTLTLQGKVTKLEVLDGQAGISNAYASSSIPSAEAFAYNAYDAAGNVVYSITPTFNNTPSEAFSSASNSAAATLTVGYGLGDLTCTGNAKGSGSFYLSYSNNAGETIKSPVYTANCFGTAVNYKASLDKASYVSGDVATLTITATDSKGNVVNDYVYLGGLAADGTGTTNAPSIAGSNMTAIATPTSIDMFSGGKKTYKFIVGSTEGSYSMSVDLPKFNSTTYAQTAVTASYKIAGSGAVSNADVLKAIVSLIASINKQIAALQKALLKK